ncbi:Ubiquinone/menaquinone biosynthesis C-methyltransferase UbiE [Echria macrotheca]|uniref:Ubiquinone/menaquinone biosynthesis C-methyltransferase UbiE n=1 Tax=Echria macrotheca TaxID=438768 RepID=A0AAJ0BKT0_9PEZI|nr:Ubiquinone/menaquinone biosynthesis C-methyltransferase UbiE [Echria macrotheca]
MEEPEQPVARETAGEWRRRNRASTEKIQQWLSPMSDHFPTPRGMHFLAAPILPATPSYLASDNEADVDVDDASSDASMSTPSTTGMWNNRQSVMTDATEFDDIYDVSDEEIQRKERLQANGIGRHRSSNRSTRSARRGSRTSMDLRRVLTPLVIPGENQNSTMKKMMSPIPPTPPSAVAMSPAIMTLMDLHQSLEVPRISAPPSLDGSVNSEELAAMSAPPTPNIGSADDDDPEWSGVRLQPTALETLHALSGSDSEYEEEPEPVIEVPQEMSETRQLPRLLTGGLPTRVPSVQRQSLAGLSKLEIPSPGGFFSELSSASRLTWHTGSQGSQADVPWGRSRDDLPPPPPISARPLHLDEQPSAIIERVIEVPEISQEDLPTAIRVEETPVPLTACKIPPPPPTLPSVATSETAHEDNSSTLEAVEIIPEYDPEYVGKQQANLFTHIDRTEMWLMAQRAYLGGISDFSEDNEAAEAKSETETEVDEKPEVPAKDTPTEDSPQKKKKGVRFSEANLRETMVPRSLPSKLTRMESAFYRSFTDAAVKTCHNDVFVYRQPRFEALQAQRVSLREAHRNQLLGKYQLSVVPQSAKKRMSANVVRGDDNIIDDPEKIRADKEAEAASQMIMSSWHVAATKTLNGGRLISAPVAKRLARQSRMAPGPNGVSYDRARILDLGGQGAGDWAWHAAMQYPNTKIYTVTTKAIRQLSNSNIRGPPNHRQVAVDRLTKLPFSDDQFDLISARELHAVLKLFGENGADEWDACLAECMRVLKPGGYLEFNVLDADIMNAGPLGNAKAVEFGFALQTLGFDPNPTRAFLSRLQRAGFEDVRRAWLCLPVGPKRPARPSPSVDAEGGKTLELEAIVSGSTDNAAAVTGLAAGWSWERWLLRAEMEKAAGELRLADTVTPGEAMREAGKMIADVHAVIEEGREAGSGFRILKGYARKPRPTIKEPELDRSGTIKMVLDL